MFIQDFDMKIYHDCEKLVINTKDAELIMTGISKETFEDIMDNFVTYIAKEQFREGVPVSGSDTQDDLLLKGFEILNDAASMQMPWLMCRYCTNNKVLEFIDTTGLYDGRNMFTRLVVNRI